MNPKILIIGAGAAGIAAAVRLIRNGFTNLLILEAENRLGGRIHSVNFEGHIVDVGAQWCHGETENVVYEMCKDLNILSPSFNDYVDNTFYDSNGCCVNKDVTDALVNLAFEIYTDEGAMKNRNERFGDYFVQTYNKKVTEAFKGDGRFLSVAPKISDWFHKFVLCLESSPNWYDFTTSAHSNYKVCDGNPLLQWKNHGFHTIINVLLKQLPSNANIRNKILFNKKVTQISWKQNRVSVTCSDGSVFQASNVITTVSLGVLKQTHKTLFVPQLPPLKQTAIESVSIGTVVKIFLKFPHKWWPDDCKGYSFLWTDEDIRKVPREFPLGPVTNGKSWLVDVFGFYIIDSHPEVLLAWLVGESAPKVELLSDEVVLKGCTFLLEKFLGKKPSPVAILCSRWCQNSNFRGCYSYRSTRAEETKTGARELGEPLEAGGKFPVLFAGEATHEWFYSTVHGAIETGFREADRIVDMYKNQKPLYMSKY